MHTLNLRLSPDDLGGSRTTRDRFLVVDDILLPLYRQFAAHHRFERVIVFPFSGAQVPASAGDPHGGEPAIDDYEALLAHAPTEFEYADHHEDTRWRCANVGHDRQAEGRVYSHRSTVPLHSPAARCPTTWRCPRATW